MKKQNFSLIELLIVVAIMAILAGIAIPAINKVRAQARITRAKSDVNAIKMALKQMENTYSSLAQLTAYKDDEKGKISNNYNDLITELSNPTQKNFEPKLNKRKVIFLDFKKNGWKDPWGNNYIIYIDTNYNGKLIIGKDDDGNDNDVTQANVIADSVAIYSCGPNTQDNNGENKLYEAKYANMAEDDKDRLDDIVSW